MSDRTRAILVSIGSLGDTLPFLALGKKLQARGCDVVLMANGHYRSMIEAEGLEFLETLTSKQYLDYAKLQTSAKMRESLKATGDMLLSQVDNVFAAIRNRYEPGRTVVAAQGYAVGARIAQEALGVPLATVHMQPMWMRSIYEVPTLPSWCPSFIPNLFDRLLDFAVDKGLSGPINEYRAKYNLPPVSRVLKHWWNSPQRVIGFFPDWYCRPQLDWPANVLLAGFPLLEGAQNEFNWTPVDEFLSAGDSPLVFTQTAVSKEAQRYFQVALEIAESLKRRAIFLTPHSDQLPASLPSTVRAFPFVPLAQLLSRSAVHVHHGGIGTIALTLAAGIPQVTVPMANDQPDNSARFLKLGASDLIWPKKFSRERGVAAIQGLLTSPTVAEKCRFYSKKIRETDPLAVASQSLESLRGTDAKR